MISADAARGGYYAARVNAELRAMVCNDHSRAAVHVFVADIGVYFHYAPLSSRRSFVCNWSGNLTKQEMKMQVQHYSQRHGARKWTIFMLSGARVMTSLISSQHMTEVLGKSLWLSPHLHHSFRAKRKLESPGLGISCHDR